MIEPFYATFRVKSSVFLLPDIAIFFSSRSEILPKRFYCMELYKIEASFTTKKSRYVFTHRDFYQVRF